MVLSSCTHAGREACDEVERCKLAPHASLSLLLCSARLLDPARRASGADTNSTHTRRRRGGGGGGGSAGGIGTHHRHKHAPATVPDRCARSFLLTRSSLIRNRGGHRARCDRALVSDCIRRVTGHTALPSRGGVEAGCSRATVLSLNLCCCSPPALCHGESDHRSHSQQPWTTLLL